MKREFTTNHTNITNSKLKFLNNLIVVFFQKILQRISLRTKIKK
jgi:hypothetical protein